MFLEQQTIKVDLVLDRIRKLADNCTGSLLLSSSERSVSEQDANE